MRSRINSTGRKKIPAHLAEFAVSGNDGDDPHFIADLKLGELKLPDDAEVIVEAYRQSVSERFDFGTVRAPGPRDGTVLRELAPEELSFRVKVVEPGTGRLLARGDRFRVKGEDDIGRQELLKVIIRDLGPEPWKTELHDTEQPVLVLNDRIPNVGNSIRKDPLFQALILPAALRQILLSLWALRAEKELDDDDDWMTRWLDFAEGISGQDPPEWEDAVAARAWIDDVCRAFGKQHSFMKVFEE